jgi:hypothetical protein
MSVISGFEKLLAQICESIQSFSSDRTRVDLACAVVAGVSLPAAFFGFLRISVLARINPPSLTRIATTILFCVACYLTAALLVIWVKSLRRIVPSWMLIAILGSTVLVISGGIWSRPEILQFPLSELSEKLRDAVGVIIGVSIFTLPFTAAVHYSDAIVRTIGKWHNGEDNSLSIMGKKRG